MPCLTRRHICHLVIVLIVIAGHTSSAPTDATVKGQDSTEVDCRLDHDNSNPSLNRCLEKGKKFVKRLINKLTVNDQSYDICGPDSRKFLDCIDPLAQRCPSIRHSLHGHWRNVTDYINGVCTDKKQEYEESYECFLKEYGAPLVGRCDAIHTFNVNQGTRDTCHFLRENVNCKDALITSKCGELTGTFTYHTLRLFHDKFMRQEGCHLPRNPHYTGFRYTDMEGKCSNFLEDVKECIKPHISRAQMLKFRDDNVLVVDGNQNYKKKDIKEACSRFKAYQQCLAPVNESCPRGVQQVYEIDSDLRKYVMKMDFICGRGKKGYFPSIKCYNKLHDDNFMSQCNNNLWDDVATHLKNMTSHNFYCEPNKPNVEALKRELQNIGRCYKEVIENVDGCGMTAGQTLVDFMDINFQDPASLRLGFRADCELHRELTTTRKPAPTPTTWRHHKSSVVESDKPPQRDPTGRDPTLLISIPSRTESPKSDKSVGSNVSHSTRHRCSVFSLLVTFLYALHFMIT